MPISNAVQKGDTVEIYDENGKFIRGFINAELKGYTSSTVTILRNQTVKIMDDKGKKFVRFAHNKTSPKS
jgi:hypothetical protein